MIHENARNKIRNRAKIISCLFVFLFALISVWPVAAEDSTSTNFNVRAPVIDIFGGRSTSNNFENFGAGGQISPGESTSNNFIIRSGFLYFEAPGAYAPKSQNWRWYKDQNNETPTAPLANENVAPTTVAAGNVVKLRLTIKETGGATGTDIKMRIQFDTSSTFPSPTFLAEIGSCGSTIWCYGDGVDTDNDPVTSWVLTDPPDAYATHNESGTSATTYDHLANSAAEWEFTIFNNGAPISTNYYFRAYDKTNGAAVPLNTGESYPSLVTQAGGLTLNLGGLPSETETEGITTDIATTATTIPFGSLSYTDLVAIGAQRFTVTTNAESGYQILAYGRQNLLNIYNEAINPVTGTNEVPTSWTSGCLSAAVGCYGYHPGDDTLSGASPARFAPPNTYAGFLTTMKEVAYSSIPVTDETTDLVFKIEITNQQEAGQYSSEIVYILVPTF